jgi:hypothetical protein
MIDIVNAIINDESPAEISDLIKEKLYVKSAVNIEQLKPYVANSIFDEGDYSEEE